MRPDVPPVCPFPDNVGTWLVQGHTAATALLADPGLRAARRSEYVPGVSRSFFLALENATSELTATYQQALVAAISPKRVREVYAPAFRGIADRLLAALPARIMDDFLRPYGRRTSLVLAGIDAMTAVELIARLRVASQLDASDPGRRQLVREVLTTLRSIGSESGFTAESIPGHAVEAGMLTSDEAVLLALPILEMAAATLRRGVPVDASPETVRRLVRDGAAGLTGIFLTRVAESSVTAGEVALSPGDRVVIDVEKVNHDAPDPEVHLSFGRGRHSCLGRELASSLAESAVAAIGARATVDGGMLLPRRSDG
jgi:cytochrome P450